MLTFDPIKHHYFWNGARVPSTTEICSILAPREWSIDEYYLEKGRLVHLITQWDDEDVLDESSVDANLGGYLRAYRKFRNDISFFPVHIETLFYHPAGFSGRPDRWGLLKSNSVLDLKTGDKHDADKFQAAAYLFGMKAMGHKTERAWDLYLRKNGTYRLEEIKQPTKLFLEFCGGIKKWREENNVNGN